MSKARAQLAQEESKKKIPIQIAILPSARTAFVRIIDAKHRFEWLSAHSPFATVFDGLSSALSD
ncbi:hypothetical protein [Helicobacter felis]|uniref:hypothetical protein n=1 Tax=Helicobacter felis TaxID=214 RepID=UPI000CF055EB|nr:hypothetical protein [Helicobacter felis]